jgi:hypothetical protein
MSSSDNAWQGLSESDEALLYDIFRRVLAERVPEAELQRYSFDSFEVLTQTASDGSRWLQIKTAVGYDVSVEWDGSIANAIQLIVDIAVTTSLDIA